MDDLVRQAMAKWPNVPDCYGWLGLDARGDWYMRDDQTQAQGPFTKSKGSRLQHEKLMAFIGRNYTSDKQGRWYFQNGPQRVYVELAATPWVWRLSADFKLTAQTGEETQAEKCWTDETGKVYFQTPLGFGLLHTMDVALAAEGLSLNVWPLETIQSNELPTKFAYCMNPASPALANKKPL
jgi:hypothetical protein